MTNSFSFPSTIQTQQSAIINHQQTPSGTSHRSNCQGSLVQPSRKTSSFQNTLAASRRGVQEKKLKERRNVFAVRMK